MSLQLLQRLPFRRAALIPAQAAHVVRSRSLLFPTQQLPTTTRAFSTSPPLQKKKKEKTSTEAASASGSNNAPDPFDFSSLHDGIGRAISRFKEDLQKLRGGGRFNPEVLTNLRVQVSKNSNDKVKLGDVAQVVPKGGRAVTVIVGEEDLVKPITSAILSSNLSLTPQPDSQNPLQLHIPIPPPTREAREQTIKTAKADMDRAAAAVKSARAVVHKRLQEMQKKKEARPDDVRRAHDQMEKIVEKGQKEIKDMFEAARKAVEQG